MLILAGRHASAQAKTARWETIENRESATIASARSVLVKTVVMLGYFGSRSRWMVTSGFLPIVNVSMASIHCGFPDVAPTSFSPLFPLRCISQFCWVVRMLSFRSLLVERAGWKSPVGKKATTWAKEVITESCWKSLPTEIELSYL